eukprot:TRINITY_DN11152_c0_g1_i2.p1 TRINITY_DN11152_c0_g1~~TRINITY_DN11152_c0_g1_i2.p1  ORF type:complete len:152 (+),score=6.88 TRINITY_DN11152_c0_g1_i2:127-582(+)
MKENPARIFRKSLSTLMLDSVNPATIYGKMFHEQRDFIHHKIFWIWGVGSTILFIQNVIAVISTPQQANLRKSRMIAHAVISLTVFIALAVRRRWNSLYLFTFELIITSLFLVLAFMSIANPNPKPQVIDCLLYTSPSPRDRQKSRMPSSA